MITYTISSKHFNLPSLTTPLLSFNLFWCSDLRRKKQQTLSCSETVCRTLIFVQNVDGTSYLDQAVELRQWFVVNSLWSLGVLWVEFVCVTCMITSLYVVFLCCSRAQERILCSYFPCDYISCFCTGRFCIFINQILNRGKEQHKLYIPLRSLVQIQCARFWFLVVVFIFAQLFCTFAFFF